VSAPLQGLSLRMKLRYNPGRWPTSVNLRSCPFDGIEVCWGMSTANQGLAELENWEILRSFLPPEWGRAGASSRGDAGGLVTSPIRNGAARVAAASGHGLVLWRRRRHGLRPRFAQIKSVVFQEAARCRTLVRWLAQQMRGAADLPLTVADGGYGDDAPRLEPGSTGTDWKVHWR